VDSRVWGEQVLDITLSRQLFRSSLAALIMLAFSAGALAGTLYAWHFARLNLSLRTMCLLASIAMAMTGTLFLAIAMRQVDKPLLRHVLPWYVRVTLKLNKRIILVAQLVSTGLALASAFLLAFDFKIPAI
jgi:hypothetical protein